jgi:hypothetical protein
MVVEGLSRHHSNKTEPSEKGTITLDVMSQGPRVTHEINATVKLLAALLVILPLPTLAETVSVPEPPRYSYESASVRQLRVRGEFGRYITFIGRTINEWSGSSGSPGTVNCTTTNGYTNCQRTGYVAPSPGGSEIRSFVYELDCVDRTFDRKGDKATSGVNHGWMSIDKDPTAQAVADRYCSSINSLPTGTVETGKTVGQMPDPKQVNERLSSVSNISDQLALAEYLRSKGAKFYGAWWCPHCQEQKDLFGPEATLRLPYIECDKDDVGRQRCQSAGLRAFPSWEINGQRYEGVLSLEELKQLSGYRP